MSSPRQEVSWSSGSGRGKSLIRACGLRKFFSNAIAMVTSDATAVTGQAEAAPLCQNHRPLGPPDQTRANGSGLWDAENVVRCSNDAVGRYRIDVDVGEPVEEDLCACHRDVHHGDRLTELCSYGTASAD